MQPTRLERLIAAASFSFLVIAALLLWTAYKDRAAGVSLANVGRFLGAGACVAMSVKGAKLRHSRRE